MKVGFFYELNFRAIGGGISLLSNKWLKTNGNQSPEFQNKFCHFCDPIEWILYRMKNALILILIIRHQRKTFSSKAEWLCEEDLSNKKFKWLKLGSLEWNKFWYYFNIQNKWLKTDVLRILVTILTSLRDSNPAIVPSKKLWPLEH